MIEKNAWKQGLTPPDKVERLTDVAEVITHEIPEDDVPGEYLDNDEHLA